MNQTHRHTSPTNRHTSKSPRSKAIRPKHPVRIDITTPSNGFRSIDLKKSENCHTPPGGPTERPSRAPAGVVDEKGTMERTTIRAPEELLRKFDRVTADSRSEAIRRLMEETVAREEGELDSEQLATAYNILLDHADHYDNGARRVDAAEVAPIIANECNVEGGKHAVHGRIFRPLERRGYLKPRVGYLWIKPRGVDPVEWSK